MGKYENVNWCNVRKVLKRCSVGGCYVKIVLDYDFVRTYYLSRRIGSSMVVGTSDSIDKIETSLDLQMAIWQLWNNITSIQIYKNGRKYGC